MAFTVEEISRALYGDREATEAEKELAAKIIAMHDEDIKGLKGTNAELKKEKTELKQRYDADIEKFAQQERDFQAQLQQAVAAGGSNEETKKYYETQQAQLDAAYRVQLDSRDKTIAEKEKVIKELEHRDLIRSQEAEFAKEVAKTKADPIMYPILQNMIIGDGSRFAPHDTPDGTIFWATDKSGETITNRLDKILASEQGKHFVMFDSTGSGADVGTSSFGASSEENPFITGNATDQAILFRRDPKLYAELERQAKAKGY